MVSARLRTYRCLPRGPASTQSALGALPRRTAGHSSDISKLPNRAAVVGQAPPAEHATQSIAPSGRALWGSPLARFNERRAALSCRRGVRRDPVPPAWPLAARQLRRVAAIPAGRTTSIGCLGSTVCPCDTQSVERTRWAANRLACCRLAAEGRLAYLSQPSDLASHLKMIFFGHTGRSASIWGLVVRAGGFTRAAAGSGSSYSVLTLTTVTRAGTVK